MHAAPSGMIYIAIINYYFIPKGVKYNWEKLSCTQCNAHKCSLLHPNVSVQQNTIIYNFQKFNIK